MKYVLTILYLLIFFPASTLLADVNEIDSVYSQSEQLLIEKKYGEFSEQITDLIKYREFEGYSNLVPLSVHLIEAGRSTCSMKDSNCGFFLKSAVLLSPTDPWTLFAAASLASSSRESVSYFFSALKNAGNSPTFFYKTWIVFGIFSLALLSLYVSLKVLFGIIRFELKRLSLRSMIIFTVLSLIGLPFGLVSTALCWSLIILLFAGRKKEILNLLLLTIAWIAFLPTAENIVRYVSRPEERELELLLSKVNSPSLNLISPKYLNEPLYLGTKAYREGDFQTAKDQFSRVRSSDRTNYLVALSRSAATDLALKDFQQAKLTIENAHAQGLNSYELIHNEATLAAATANLNQSRELLDKLKALDNDRLGKESLSASILLEPVSRSVFSDRYLEPLERHLQTIPPPVQWISGEKMLIPLCSFGLTGLLALSFVMAALLVLPTQKLRALV